jgi:hypothetical protein
MPVPPGSAGQQTEPQPELEVIFMRPCVPGGLALVEFIGACDPPQPANMTTAV